MKLFYSNKIVNRNVFLFSFELRECGSKYIYSFQILINILRYVDLRLWIYIHSEILVKVQEITFFYMYGVVIFDTIKNTLKNKNIHLFLI